MSVVSVDDYLERGEHEVYASYINQAIANLTRAIDYDQEHEGQAVDEDVAALAALVAFRGEVQRLTGGPFDSATIVPDAEFAGFARDYIRELIGDDLDLANRPGSAATWSGSRADGRAPWN